MFAVPLRRALYVPNFGTFAEPSFVADLAAEAERAGWDGFFMWDQLLFEVDVPISDSWMTLAAVATATQRIQLGPLVTPLPRRRPWKVAREAVTLDRLSAGRLVLGVGLGGDWYRELSAFGESDDLWLLAERLDEGLQLIVSLWSGEVVRHEGRHYRAIDVRFVPRPMQSPRIPIWVAAVWPNRKPLRRAARWDGVCPIRADQTPLDPTEVEAIAEFLRAERGSLAGFDVVVQGSTLGLDEAGTRRLLEQYGAAGATWWLESLRWDISAQEARAVVRRGLPAITTECEADG